METSQVQNVPISPTQKITDSDMKKLKIKRWIFGTIFLYILLSLLATNAFFLFIEPIIIFFLSYFFLRNENTLAIATYLTYWNQISITPWIRYWVIWFTFTLLFLVMKLIFIFWFNQDSFFLFYVLGKVVILLTVIIAYLLNGILLSKLTVLRNSVSQTVFSEKSKRIGKYILLSSITWFWLVLFWTLFLLSMGPALIH